MYFKKVPKFVQRNFPKIIWNAEIDTRLSLSFDDGPDPSSTPILLKKLNNLNKKASFFCLGHKVDKNPSLLNEIKSEGHLVGSHGYYHLDGWKTPTSKYLENLYKGQRTIQSEYYRPPFGRLRYPQYKSLVGKLKIVMWTLMPGDFDPLQTSQQIHKFLTKHHLPNSSVVLHDHPEYIDKVVEIMNFYIDEFSFINK